MGGWTVSHFLSPPAGAFESKFRNKIWHHCFPIVDDNCSILRLLPLGHLGIAIHNDITYCREGSCYTWVHFIRCKIYRIFEGWTLVQYTIDTDGRSFLCGLKFRLEGWNLRENGFRILRGAVFSHFFNLNFGPAIYFHLPWNLVGVWSLHPLVLVEYTVAKGLVVTESLDTCLLLQIYYLQWPNL